MPRCVKCGGVLPEGCPSCPPKIINCPKCGVEVLIEPSMDARILELTKGRKNR